MPPIPTSEATLSDGAIAGIAISILIILVLFALIVYQRRETNIIAKPVAPAPPLPSLPKEDEPKALAYPASTAFTPRGGKRDEIKR